MKHRQRGGWMSFALPLVGALCLAASMTVSLTTARCAEHHYYRVYDPCYRDYHVWNDSEVVYYQRWAAETHHDPNRDFQKIPPDEQKDYWNWRLGHPR
jgi:hypothetical protein